MKRVKSVNKNFFVKSVKSLKEYSCVSAAFVHLLHVRKEKKMLQIMERYVSKPQTSAARCREARVQLDKLSREQLNFNL